jgi:hypothetical protein
LLARQGDVYVNGTLAGLASKMPAKRIFISSTYLDLKPERQAVEQVLHRMKDVAAIAMEFFGSRPETPKQVSLDEVARSDLYVGIFGERYGYIDPESGLSITELEYREAVKRRLPCLVYLKHPESPSEFRETDPISTTQLERLKNDLRREHTITVFNDASELATQIAIDLHNVLLDGQLPRSQEERKQVTARELHIVICTRVSMEELKTLSFYVGVKWDHLAGDTLPSKATALIEYMINRDRFEEFVNELRAMRPDLKL